MKRMMYIMFIFISAGLFANENFLTEADRLFNDGNYNNGVEFIEEKLDLSLSDSMKAELYWRMSRFLLLLGDNKKAMDGEKNEITELYNRGLESAGKAIKLNPDVNAYYWRASNTGRHAEMKGILSSLVKAKPMKEDLISVIMLDAEYSDSFYVLGRLYFLVPGWPISFGNKKKAVSFARRAVILTDSTEFKNFVSLAEMLWDRNWSIKTREKEIPKMEKDYKKNKTEFDRMCFYEYKLGLDFCPVYSEKVLGKLSDREEALMIIEWLKEEFRKIEKPEHKLLEDMKELEEIAASWNL